MILIVDFSENEKTIPVGFTENRSTMEADFGEIQTVGDGKKYQGQYEVTPAAEPQTLPTAHKIMAADVIVNAIPKEYGLVTYNQDKIIKIT